MRGFLPLLPGGWGGRMKRLASGRPTCPVAGRSDEAGSAPFSGQSGPGCHGAAGEPPGSAALALQVHPGFHVVGPGELVEQGEAGDLVGFTEHGHVGLQGLGVAGDVEDVVVILHQLDGGVVQTGPGRVDEDGVALVGAEIDPLEAVELPLAAHRHGELLRRHAQDDQVVDTVGGDVELGGVHARLGDLGGQHLAKVLRQSDGEVAVAAVELQQVPLAPLGHVQGPAQHLFVDGGVGLGEAVFHLLVDQLAPLHGQAFDDEVIPQADLLLVGAANQLQLEPLGTQVGLKRLGGLLPLGFQLAVVEQADADLAGLGGEIVDLEQLLAQHGVRAQPGQQHRHQPVDEQAGGGEAVDPDNLLGGRCIHAVEEVVPLVPDAELGAHPVVLGGRGVQLQRGRIEGGEQLGEAIALLVELGLVVGRSPSALGVGGRWLGLSHGYLACTGLSRGKTGGRPQPTKGWGF